MGILMDDFDFQDYVRLIAPPLPFQLAKPTLNRQPINQSTV
jgi:hypothetical protein